MDTYGYVRVSTKEQNEDRQIIAMREFGVADRCIVLDKQSGKDFERPGYRRLMQKLKAGDTLVIKSIDRLGRNYDEILDQWRLLTKENQVAIVVLDIPLLDTRQGRDLTGVPITDIGLQLLSYMAQASESSTVRGRLKGLPTLRSKASTLDGKLRTGARTTSLSWLRGAGVNSPAERRLRNWV